MALKVYANEHPKNKKKDQDKNVKVADAKTIGGKTYTTKQFKALSPSESFMNYYNHFIEMGYTPKMAFDKASWHNPYKD